MACPSGGTAEPSSTTTLTSKSKFKSKSAAKRYMRPTKVSSVNQLRGRPAIMCTCVNGRFDERKALDEATELLTDAVEALYPVDDEDDDNIGSDDLVAAAQAEIRVTAHDLETPGLLYFTFPKQDVDATAVAAHVADHFASQSRRVARLAPFAAVCFASVDDVVEAVKGLLEKTSSSNKPKLLDPAATRTFAVEVKRRHNTDFPKEDAIRRVADLVPKSVKVDLSRPDATILVHVFKSVAGVSVVERYAARHGFNLHAIRTTSDKTKASPTSTTTPAEATTTTSTRQTEQEEVVVSPSGPSVSTATAAPSLAAAAAAPPPTTKAKATSTKKKKKVAEADVDEGASSSSSAKKRKKQKASHAKESGEAAAQ